MVCRPTFVFWRAVITGSECRRVGGTRGNAGWKTGGAALKNALLRAHININDPATIKLLSCLQNVHDVFGVGEWRERLCAIAAQFGLSPEHLKDAA